MTVSLITIAVAAAAQAATPQGGVKWVPLNAVQAPQTPSASVSAQPAVVQPAAPKTNPATRFLPAGTMISLTTLQELSSKHLRRGERYQFEVVNDVTENGVVVIPRGSIATGVVSMETGRAIGGKSGKFDISFESVTANGVTYPLSGVHRQEGKGNTVGALLGSIWISGHSAVMLPGDIVTAFVKERTAY